MSYNVETFFVPSLFTVNDGTLLENTVDGGVTFVPNTKNSYVEFVADAPVIKINLTKTIDGEFYVYLNGKPIAYKYLYTSSLEKDNFMYIRLNGSGTLRIQANMTGKENYSIDLISYVLLENPFRIGDLQDFRDGLLSQYFNSGFSISSTYYGRALCSLYQRGDLGLEAYNEVVRVADYHLSIQDATTKRVGNGIFNNGSIIHFLYKAYEVTGDVRYKTACEDFIRINILEGAWAKSTQYPEVFQTTDGYDSVTYNHNYFLGEALIYIGEKEGRTDYIDIGLAQFTGTSSAISAEGRRPMGSRVTYVDRNYVYQEAFQNLRTGYQTNNALLIADGKKLLNYAENLADEAPPDWIIQNRILRQEGVYYEVFHENVSCVALPYYYMSKNNDPDLKWKDSKRYVESAFTLFDQSRNQYWFAQNYHTDYYIPATFHSLCWYLESGLYDDLKVDKTTGAVNLGVYEPVDPTKPNELSIFKIRVCGINGAVHEALLKDTKESEISFMVNTTYGIKYANLVANEDINASNIRIATRTGEMSLEKPY